MELLRSIKEKSEGDITRFRNEKEAQYKRDYEAVRYRYMTLCLVEEQNRQGGRVWRGQARDR